MATLKVRGRGTVPAQPDEAVVAFELVALADGAAEAFATAGERAQALGAVLDDADIPVERRSTVGIVLHEHQELDPSGQPRRTHRASTTVTVRLADPDAIPALLQAGVERAEAYVRGPMWRLSDSSAAAAEACRRAIADATGRAEAYASALGARIGSVETVEEIASGEAMPAAGVHLRAVAAADAPPLYPGELQVSSLVDVVFALEPA
jgi:uncharacterized protein YggE